MTDANPWAYWQAMLAWKAKPNAKLPTPDFDKHHPEQGYYRGQRNEAVAIWWDRTRSASPSSTGRAAPPPTRSHLRSYDQADQIGDSVFAYCCRNPVTITKSTWCSPTKVLAGGHWGRNKIDAEGGRFCSRERRRDQKRNESRRPPTFRPKASPQPLKQQFSAEITDADRER